MPARTLVWLSFGAAVAAVALLSAAQPVDAGSYWTADFPNFSTFYGLPPPVPADWGIGSGHTSQIAITNQGALPDVALIQLDHVPVAAIPIPPHQTVFYALAGKTIGTQDMPVGYHISTGYGTVVTQYSVVANTFTNDAARLIDDQLMGTDYTVLARGTGAASFIMVIGTEDHTTVDVDPTAWVEGNYIPPKVPEGNAPFTIKLNSHEVLYLQTPAPGGDFSGSTVRADKKVAVFAGNTCTVTPNSSCDMVVEQLYPAGLGGKHFVACALKPFDDNFTNIIRIVPVSGAATTVTFTPGGTQSISGPTDFTVDYDVEITTSNTVIAGQFFGLAAPNPPLYSTNPISVLPAAPGDPALVILMPTGLWGAALDGHAVFSLPGWGNGVTVAAAPGSTASMDGGGLTFNAIPGSSYTCAQQTVNPGTHAFSTPILSKVYVTAVGWEKYGSYWFNGNAHSGPNPCIPDVLKCIDCDPLEPQTCIPWKCIPNGPTTHDVWEAVEACPVDPPECPPPTTGVSPFCLPPCPDGNGYQPLCPGQCPPPSTGIPPFCYPPTCNPPCPPTVCPGPAVQWVVPYSEFTGDPSASDYWDIASAIPQPYSPYPYTPNGQPHYGLIGHRGSGPTLLHSVGGPWWSFGGILYDWASTSQTNFASPGYAGSDLPRSIDYGRQDLMNLGGGAQDWTIVLITTGEDLSSSMPGYSLANQALIAKSSGVRIAIVHVRDGYGDVLGSWDHAADLQAIASWANPTGTGSLTPTLFYYPVDTAQDVLTGVAQLLYDMDSQGAYPDPYGYAQDPLECLPPTPYPDCSPALQCVPVVECPPPLSGTAPDCVLPPQPCPPPFVGEIPNCALPVPPCPPPLVGTVPHCALPPQPCPPPLMGDLPDCTLPPTSCPPPFAGEFPDCTLPPQPCPPPFVGSLPDCTLPPTPCPPPLSGNLPNCGIGEIGLCPKGQIGVQPICYDPGPCPPPLKGDLPACTLPMDCPEPFSGTLPKCSPPPIACPAPLYGNLPDCVANVPCPAPFGGMLPHCTVPPPCPPGSVGPFVPYCFSWSPPECPAPLVGAVPNCLVPCPAPYSGYVNAPIGQTPQLCGIVYVDGLERIWCMIARALEADATGMLGCNPELPEI